MHMKVTAPQGRGRDSDEEWGDVLSALRTITLRLAQRLELQQEIEKGGVPLDGSKAANADQSDTLSTSAERVLFCMWIIRIR